MPLMTVCLQQVRMSNLTAKLKDLSFLVSRSRKGNGKRAGNKLETVSETRRFPSVGLETKWKRGFWEHGNESRHFDCISFPSFPSGLGKRAKYAETRPTETLDCNSDA